VNLMRASPHLTVARADVTAARQRRHAPCTPARSLR
jgi:hypothetical protein